MGRIWYDGVIVFFLNIETLVGILIVFTLGNEDGLYLGLIIKLRKVLWLDLTMCSVWGWEMDTIGLYTEIKILIIWCTCTLTII